MNVRGERILVFGDSLSHHGPDSAPEIWDVNMGSARNGAPGDLLASMLLEAGAQAVRVDANVGRSAGNFWTAPNKWQSQTASKLLAADQTFKPTKVIVMLGTNDASAGAMDLASIVKIRDTYRAMGATEIIAIGPPLFASPVMTTNAVKVYATLSQVFPTVIDARPLSSTAGRTSDGIHFGAAAAKAFSLQLASKVIDSATTAPARPVWSGVMLAFSGVLALGLLAIWWSRHGLRGLGEIDEADEEDPDELEDVH